MSQNLAPSQNGTHRAGTARAVAGINIALVKYWGKVPGPGNRPAVGSLSLTLDAPGTATRVTFDPQLTGDCFVLDGVALDPEAGRVTALLDTVRALAGSSTRASVESVNTVPTAAGLASSASGFAALGVAAWRAAGLPERDGELDPRLVELVRVGSGSAPRSLLGGFARMERETGALRPVYSPEGFAPSLVIALTVAGPKDVSSRDGMGHCALTSPYYRAWVETHVADLDAAEAAIAAADLAALGEVMEHSTLKMHACMLAARPALRYWGPATVAALDAVAALRRAGVGVWATMDAGPHVKALCAPADAARVAAALRPVSREVLVARPGRGAGEGTAGEGATSDGDAGLGGARG